MESAFHRTNRLFFYETVKVTLGIFHARRHKNVSCTSDCAKWQSETVTPARDWRYARDIDHRLSSTLPITRTALAFFPRDLQSYVWCESISAAAKPTCVSIRVVYTVKARFIRQVYTFLRLIVVIFSISLALRVSPMKKSRARHGTGFYRSITLTALDFMTWTSFMAYKHVHRYLWRIHDANVFFKFSRISRFKLKNAAYETQISF